MPTMADLQAVKDYAGGLAADQRKDFVDRYNSLSTDGKATLVSRIAGGSKQAPNVDAADANIQDDAAHEAMLQHTKDTQDLGGRFAYNLTHNPLTEKNKTMAQRVMNASMHVPTLMAEGAGALFQKGEDLAARGMQAYANDNGAGLPDVPQDQLHSVGAFERGLGAPPAIADAAGVAATGSVPGMAELGQGVRAVGDQALKLSGKAGLNLTRYFQILGGKNPEEITRLQETGYKNVNKETMAQGGKFVQDLGDEMNQTVQKMGSRVQSLWQRFNKVGATEQVHPTVTSNLAQEAQHLLSPEQESSRDLVDQILNAKVNKEERPYEPMTRVTKRQQVVTYPQAEKQYTTQGETTVKGGLSEGAATTDMQDLSEKGALQEPQTVKEVETRSATHYPGRTQTVPVTVGDTLNDMAQGKKFTSGQVKNLSDMLSNIAGPGGQNNPRAAKLAQLFKDTLKDSSKSYQRASEANYVFSQARDAGDVLYGGAHDLYPNSASEANRIPHYYDTLQGSPTRMAPHTIDAGANLLLGKDTGYADKVKDAAAVYDLANPKPSLFASSHLGNISQSMGQMGAPTQALGVMKSLMYGLGLPKGQAYASKFFSGNMKNARAAALLNSPAGYFIRNSTAAQAGIKTMQGAVSNSDGE